MRKWLALACVLAAGCGLVLRRHPVQQLSDNYVMPERWVQFGCRPRGDTFKGSPVLICDDGLRMIDRRGNLEEFVTWAEIRGDR